MPSPSQDDPPEGDTLTRAHALDATEVCAQLGVDPEHGLDEREARARLTQYGRNRLREVRSKPASRILLEQFTSTLILVLVAAEVVALVFGHWAEAIAIAAVLIVNAAIGFLTEWRAVRAMDALRSLSHRDVRVRRDGQERAVHDEELVPGDVIVVEGGDRAPADLRLLEANGLQVDEAALTGESVPVAKRTGAVPARAPLAERTGMLYQGTIVTEGSGHAVVVATGMATELGRISDLAASAEAQATPLQRRLDRLGRRLAVLTLATAVLIAGLGLVLGQDPTRMIETAIALGVAAIPEGLPIVATIALARGMWLLARQHALVNRLPAVETLGATGVICTDKTGTLTENRMTVARVVTSHGAHDPTVRDGGAQTTGTGDAGGLLARILEVGALCNNAAAVDAEEEADAELQGDPTEVALVRAAAAHGIEREALLGAWPEVREEPFDPGRMLMATVHRRDGEVRVAVKGAPDAVLEHCTAVAREDGEASLDDSARESWRRRSEELASDGLRVLAVAEKTVSDEGVEPYERLVLLGMIGLHDPPRPHVRWAVSECRGAGITVVLATGDQTATARAIALATGIVDDVGADVVPGHQLEESTPSDEDVARMRAARVFARVSPEQKLRLVEVLQQGGATVAMTGDGINDAPALKAADIGVAMGRRGTDAARQVADMVLQDDAFETIVAAVRQGRVIFDDIRKSVMFMLCTNLAEVLAVALASVLGAFTQLPLPLLPLQILYLNVLTDVFPALALAVGRGDPDVMERPPRPSTESILTPAHWREIAGWSALIAAAVLTALAVASYGLDLPREAAVTVSFLTLAFGKLWFTFVLRSPGSHPIDNDVVRNRYVWGALALCIPLLLAAVYLPGLSDVLRTASPGPRGWAVLLGFSLIPFGVGQGVRAVQASRATRP